MAHRIIINADDFGFSEGTNHAVRRLAQLGTISSTSLMVNMPFVEDIRVVLRESPRLGVGLHLNLTQGKPLSPVESVRSLVGDDGNFLSPRALLRGAWAGRVSMAEVRKEVSTQIEDARRLVGGRLDHWDSHQGCHRFEPLATVILGVFREYAVPAMRTHRHWFTSSEAPHAVSRPGVASWRRFPLRRIIAESYYEWLWHRCARDFDVSQGLFALPGAKGPEVFRYLARNGAPPLLLEVPCHPAANTEGLWGTRLLQDRVDEFEALASDEFRHAVESGHLRLINFAEIAQEGGRRHEELEAALV